MTEENSPLSSLGTLSAQLLGVVAILIQELARSKAVDVDRLQRTLEAFLDNELAQPSMADGDKRMVASVKKVLGGLFVKPEEGDGQRG